MNQEKKKQIHQMLKAIMPKSWKWSLAVRNHSTIVLNIREANENLTGLIHKYYLEDHENRLQSGLYSHEPELREHYQVHHGSVGKYFEGDLLNLFKEIVACLNLNNYDNSDIMTDYFDVGHYVDINVGVFGKPFRYNAY